MEHECSKAIDINTWRFTMWRRSAARRPRDESLALVRVETPTLSGGLTLVAPSGHRIEGLVLEQVTTLLREFA
jgi:hypothetical protein